MLLCPALGEAGLYQAWRDVHAPAAYSGQQALFCITYMPSNFFLASHSTRPLLAPLLKNSGTFGMDVNFISSLSWSQTCVS